ncbi:MAG: alpha-2-macroglobulin family protein [Ferruginibacter sp.]
MYKRIKWLASILLLLITQLAFSQQKMNDYSANWKKVEDLEKKGLTKSAKEEVLKIYDLAIKDRQDAQQIKASMYLIKYRNLVEEDNQENNIFYVDTLIANAKAPVKNILQSMQAQMFWQYLQNNRWKLYNRTNLTEEKSKDIATWSMDKLYSTATRLYTASLLNEALLKSTKLDSFDPILTKGENTRSLRPTLFDFLVFRALAYFTNSEKDVNKPAYAFTLNDEKIFSPADQFVNLSFKTKDSASLYHKAIGLYQDILKFHLSDASPAALIDADIARLQFMYTNAVIPEKQKLYEASLQYIEHKYPDAPATAMASYRKAHLHYTQGQEYDPLLKTENQYEIKRAKNICEAIVRKFTRTEGAANAQNLINTILMPSLRLQTEKVNVIGQPFRSLVNYTNISKLYFRIVKTNREDIIKLDQKNYENQWAEITKLKALKEWNIDLPDLQDYQQHAVEIKSDALSNGIYYIIASKSADFSVTKNILAKQLIYLSNISYIHNNNDYYVLDRDNGQPLSAAKVQVWERNYNSNSSRYDFTKAETYSTDSRGYFKMKDSKSYRNVSFQFINGSDELFMNEEQNVYDYYNYATTEKIKPVTFLFTDRSIYRPGQTVFFKGIVVSRNNNNRSDIVPDFKTAIYLKDANNQNLSNITVTSNEFGSFNGSFKLPEGILNGLFTITDNNTGSTQQISVEEYKRPKFFTEMPKPKGTYRINDSISITGTAKAYAGNNIDGAKVKYRVVRKVQYPIWWGYWGYTRKMQNSYRPIPNSGSTGQEITSGEITTDAKGEFHISFKAIPDETVNKKDQPTFYYEVSADVTDINGETRTASTSVAVSYQALQLNIDVAAKLPVDSLNQLRITSTNTNGLEEKTTATVIIEKLKSPGKIFRERYWDQPDQFIMSKEEYYNYFPYDVYKDEDQVNKFPVASKVLERTDSTNSTFNTQHSTFTAGWYKITAFTKDKYGEDVRAEKYVELTDENQTVIDKAISVNVKKSILQPGEKIQYNIASGFDKVWLIHTRNFMGKKKITDYTEISNSPKSFEIPVTETDRGGISMDIIFVKHNRVYNDQETFAVPWSNKELNISYNTFRDKLLPGANEKWSVKISGSKGEKTAAEMLVSMYDASLDQFKPHDWTRLSSLWPSIYPDYNWTNNSFTSVQSQEKNDLGQPNIYYVKSYDELNGFGNNQFYLYYSHDMNPDIRFAVRGDASIKGLKSVAAPVSQLLQGKIPGIQFEKGRFSSASDTLSFNVSNPNEHQNTSSNDAVQIRKNFNETAFFFPDLKTDADGNVEFSFTIPEALTQWKLMTMAHTKDLASGYSEQKVITQKDLMVQPNAPRFMREGDRMEFSAKIVNLSDKEVTGQATLELLDAATNKPVDGWFKNIFPAQYFTAGAGQSIAVKFPIDIPNNFNSALTYRIIAKAGNVSDGEETSLPVLTNRTLVTESLPLNVRNTNQKDFKFEKLLKSGSSTTLSTHALTVEYTSNPAWYAVQSLPYLMEYPYECAEQTFNRYYANTLATYISNSMPAIKAVFEKWKATSPPAFSKGEGDEALLSNLQKNEELKSALLQETPWVMDAQNESQQKKNIALLFDMIKMSAEMNKALNKLKDMQLSNGGFVWFKGGSDDRYITQYIITGIGHLRKLNALNGAAYESLKSMVDKAIPYLDKKIREEYDDLLRYKVKLSDNNLSQTAIQYLYMRSFFPEYKMETSATTAVNYYKGQAKKFWLSESKYMQGMIALALFRDKNTVTANAIIKSLKENSIEKDEMGMYWKEFSTGGYYWYQSPIESQAMMIEAFSEIENNKVTIDDLKTWLLKNKQTNNWRTTKATAEACYALLLNGSNWLSEEKEVTISLGNTIIKSTDEKTEAGTGYFKKRIEGEKVKPEMGNISVSIKSAESKSPPSGVGGWGAVYWQYFEDLDKITSAETPLKLTKHLFIETNSDKGPVLKAINDGDEIKIGDKIKIRIELKVDRDMEYVHMKDMRAACMEPVNVISQYKYQGGLGYYETTKDASTNFFFSHIARGTYVFEYSVFVTHAGNFSNGITSIQCMYAPEFTSHSEGIRVDVQ